jgi:Na+-driven multidrug efflux pump
MILTSLITVADGFFIGNYVGPEGIAAVNLGLPIVYLYLALGLMVSVGGVAIAGMALGGGNMKKCSDVFNQTMCTVIAASVLLSAVMWFCLGPIPGFNRAGAAVAAGSGWYGGIFVNSEAVEELVRTGVVIFGVSFLLMGVNSITFSYFTSIGKALESAVISSARGLVILLACTFTLPPLLGMTGVWLVAPVTEGLTLLLSLFYIRKDTRALKLSS